MRLCFMLYTTAERRAKPSNRLARQPTGSGKAVKGDGRKVLIVVVVVVVVVVVYPVTVVQTTDSSAHI